MNKIYSEEIKKTLINNYDIRYRDINSKNDHIHIVYCKTMCDHQFISMHIISPLLNNKDKCTDIQYIKDNVITSCSIRDITSVDDALIQILAGNTLIILENSNQALCCESRAFNTRNVEIPPTESVIKGPREGFTENLDDEIAHIRRRINRTDLKIEHIDIKDKSKTIIVMVYIENLAPQKLVNYIRKKLSNIKYADVNYLNMLEETLRHKGTPFDTIGYTEKPDIAALKIDEGRVVVMVDGTPFVLIAPYFFIENFHTADDYSLNKYVAVVGRTLRWMSFFASALLPGLYIALFTYHFKLIPYVFIFQMARSRVSVPFPLSVEVIIMIMFFQMLREAGIRLPQPIGPALSIVGALILGDAAVKSGMASEVTVLITALTSIANFLVPGLFVAIFMCNIIVIAFSSLLGLPGFFTAFIILCTHISGLTSCGYPYIYPLGTLKSFKYKDIIIRGDMSDINQNIFKKDDNQ